MTLLCDQLIGQAATTVVFLRVALAPDAAAPPVEAIPINRTWEVLQVRDGQFYPRVLLEQAGEKLGDWSLFVGGARVDGPALLELAKTPRGEPLVRALRERLGRPVDLRDLLRFIDDLLAADDGSLRGKRIWITPARARNAGILLHVDDVFRKRKPRRYADGSDQLFIDKPKKRRGILPAEDGELLGPRWWARYQNPERERPLLDALDLVNPSRTLRGRIESLFAQLRAQGADVFLTSTVRYRQRGYLMWGAFELSRATSEEEVIDKVTLLEQVNAEWDLNIPIGWMHSAGWETTIGAARKMAETYDVVYATRRGAEKSDHYDGVAVDFTAVNLPRVLTLQAPDGAKRTFDLSQPHHSRDLSLSPKIIKWVERHFELDKLRRDYPHWNDVAEPPDPGTS